MGKLRRLTQTQVMALRAVAKGYASASLWPYGKPDHELYCPHIAPGTLVSLVKRGYIAIGGGRMPLKHRYAVHNVVLTDSGKMAVTATAKENFR